MSAVRRTALLTVALLVLSQAGCAILAVGAVGGGAVALAHFNGKITETVPASLDAAATATESALIDLGLTVEAKRVGAQAWRNRQHLGRPRALMIDSTWSRPRFRPTHRKPESASASPRSATKNCRSHLRADHTSLNNPAPASPAAPAAVPGRQTDEPPLAK